MRNIKERYLVDDNGNRIGVVLNMKHYCHLIEQLEELESIHAYDAAKASEEEVVPFEEAIIGVESHVIY
jgi:hypothetical protein